MTESDLAQFVTWVLLRELGKLIFTMPHWLMSLFVRMLGPLLLLAVVPSGRISDFVGSRLSILPF